MTLYSRTLNRRRRYLLRPRPDPTIDGIGSPPSADQVDDFDDFVFDDVAAATAADAAGAPTAAPRDREFDGLTAADPAESHAAHPHAEPLELVLTSPEGIEIEPIRIDEATCLVGSGSQTDLRLPHPDVSRNHALLCRDGERLLFGDLGSRTGLSRNGARCVCGWLVPGDVLQIGPYSLHWPRQATGDDAASAQVPANAINESSESAPTTGRRLRVIEGPVGRASETSLDRPLTLIGRGSACALRLRDRSVSRVHAAILSLENDVFAVDLARQGEPLVTDRPETCFRLDAGDELRIGPYRIALLDSSLPSAKAKAATGRTEFPNEAPEDLAAALADLQRKVHERSCRQLELLSRVVGSVEGGLQDDVLNEIETLRQMIREHENGSEPPQSANPEATAKARRARAVRRAFGGQTVANLQDRPTVKSRHLVTPPPEPIVVADVPNVDYGRIARRVAAHQQRTQTGGWSRLLRLLF